MDTLSYAKGMLSIFDSEASLKLAVEETIEGIQIIGFDWKYIYLNKAAADHGRKSKQELVGRSMQECYPGIEETGVFQEMRQVMETRVPRRLENQFEFEDRKKCWFELSVEPFPDGILIRSIDISERKDLEEELFHTQKMDAIGQLAGGIAHDFNNKLGIMMAYTDLALKRIGEKDPVVQKYLKNILVSVNQSSELTRQLLALSRKQVMDVRLSDLNEILSQITPSLEKLLGEQIQLVSKLSEDLPNVEVDSSQIDQVVLNLSINARDAMGSKGKLTIETQQVELDELYCKTHPNVTPGTYVMMAISDTGCGITSENQRRIFDPFFTTKPKEKGTGLGLSIVHGIVKQSRGHIWLYSEVNVGTVFKIYFPASNEVAKETRPVKKAEKPLTGNETILLVEDDPVLRIAYAEVLRDVGFTVLDTNGDDLMNILDTKKIDLLLTDLILPKTNGIEISKKVREKRPDIKVIFMSGYTDNTIENIGSLGPESILLRKPTSIRNLIELIQKVLSNQVRRGVF